LISVISIPYIILLNLCLSYHRFLGSIEGEEIDGKGKK